MNIILCYLSSVSARVTCSIINPQHSVCTSMLNMYVHVVMYAVLITCMSMCDNDNDNDIIIFNLDILHCSDVIHCWIE